MLSAEEVCTAGNRASDFSECDARWCSLHIFYDTDQDDLLTRCLQPLAEWLIQSRLASELFFIRHWQGGPHIRFRFRIIEQREYDNILRNVRERIALYLAQQPSSSTVSDEAYWEIATDLAQMEGETSVVSARQPNNSILVSPYVPEWKKYGGAAGVRSAERFFQGSTLLVFQMLPKIRGLREKKLGIAFAMAVTAASVFGLTRSDARDFFDAYCRLWVAPEKLEGAKRRFQTNWEKNRSTLQNVALSILAKGRSPAEANPEWLRSWQELLKNCRRELVANRTLPVSPKQSTGLDRRKWWLLLGQYLHTHDNRLGFSPHDECYLGFITSETFRNLSAETLPGYGATPEDEGTASGVSK